MKQAWQKLSMRIDGLSLRERALIFAAAAGLLIFLVFFFFLNPSYARQRQVLDDMARQQEKIAGIEAEIAKTIEAHTLDPDAAERARLAKIQADAQALKSALMAMQQGMVAPEKMSGLLEQILRTHRGLQLISLHTLGDSDAEPVAAAPVAAPSKLLHRHGVELAVKGSYTDMVAYMTALEGMQGQLLWGRAALTVDKYPNATLTLTLYTINLDKKWFKL